MNGGLLHGRGLRSKDSVCAKCLDGAVLGMVLGRREVCQNSGLQ